MKVLLRFVSSFFIYLNVLFISNNFHIIWSI